jgi:hypothetical protein
MSVPEFTFSDVDVRTGRTPEVPDTYTSDLLTNLKKFGQATARLLASHVGFEDEDFDWEGVRPLGQGAFGRVGLWVAKDQKGVNVKVGKRQNYNHPAAYMFRKLLSNNASGSKGQRGFLEKLWS